MDNDLWVRHMGRTIVHEADSDLRFWAEDEWVAEAKSIGMAESEAEAWSAFCDFVNRASWMEATAYSYREIPADIADHIVAIRRWLLSIPQERALSELDVEPAVTKVR